MSMRTKEFAWAACSTISPTMRSARAGSKSMPTCESLTLTLAFSLRACDGVEKLVVDVGGFLCFGFSGDALAERVERGGDAFVVDAFAAGEDVVDGHAGDEAAGHLSSDGGPL